MNKKAHIDWLGYVAVLLMVIGGCLVSYYYITERIDSCTRDPLMYAMKDVDLTVMNNFSIDWYSAEFTVYGMNDSMQIFQKITYNPKNKPTNWLNVSLD